MGINHLANALTGIKGFMEQTMSGEGLNLTQEQKKELKKQLKAKGVNKAAKDIENRMKDIENLMGKIRK